MTQEIEKFLSDGSFLHVRECPDDQRTDRYQTWGERKRCLSVQMFATAVDEEATDDTFATLDYVEAVELYVWLGRRLLPRSITNMIEQMFV